MMCAGCAANVERRVSGMDGVQAAAVNFAAATVLVEYDPRRVSPADMQRELEKIGYSMVIDDDTDTATTESSGRRAQSPQWYDSAAAKVILSWLLAVITMGLCMGWLDIGTKTTTDQTMLILALLNIVCCGRQFYCNAWRQLLHGMAGMDTLVAMSTAISFLFSTFNTFFGDSYWGARGMESHTYFDASVMIITFVLTGRMMEQRAKDGTASAIKALMGLSPKTALVGADSDRARRADSDCACVFVEKPIGDIQPGNIIKVRAGEKIPVDGRTEDAALYSTPSSAPLIDESMITGEPVAVAKTAGDKVYAGTIVRRGTLFLCAEAVGSKTMLANIIRMVQEAQGSKAPVQRIADRVAAVFVPVVLGIAVLTFALWWGLGGNDCLPMAVLAAVSVLVVACPCAMGLATPTALMVGIGKAAQHNILIKDAAALEQMRRVTAVVMDKTGTLTIPVGADSNRAPDDGPDLPARTCPDQPADSGSTRAALEARETLRPHAAEAVRRLKAQGIDVYLTSGDRDDAVEYWAGKAGIDRWQANVMPQDKEDLVRQLQHDKVVAMVGDGINDTQALAAADVSIAIGKGTDIAIDVAQVTLMGTDLRRIPEAVTLSRRTVRVIHQNLFWAFVYNVVCIPLAAGVPALFGAQWHMTPMVAAALMVFSSISVVLNSLRLNRVEADTNPA